MILNHFLLFLEQDRFFEEHLIFPITRIDFDYNYVFNFSHVWDNCFLSVESDLSNQTASLFIAETEDANYFKNLDNIQNIYHYSIPTTKLFYPEPYIAAASFMHSDIWFVHILVYQYWLWFVFVFIIVFFIITFLCIVRWCNMRTRPRRETRGVSRSKCGDLITAIVPVSWAASIIISESTDAIDYFDGFGTTEMVVGIRAYQWGWEYYYPKDIDLNYNVKKTHSAFTGNSLKYYQGSSVNNHANKAWKFYQNKPYDFVVTPAHLLLIPLDSYKLLNFLNFSDVGTNVFHESAIFKNTRMFSKIFNANLLFIPNNFLNKYSSISPLFNNNDDFFDSHFYGLKRQHNLLNSKAITSNFSTLFNLKNVNKLLNYNHDLNFKTNNTFKGSFLINFLKTYSHKNTTASWVFNNLNTSLHFSEFSNKFNAFLTYGSLLDKLNDNNDKKKLKRSTRKLLLSNPKKLNLETISFFRNNIFINNASLSSATFAGQFFQNNRFTNKTFTAFSANQLVSKKQETVKILANISVKKDDFNLSSTLNPATFYQQFSNKNFNINFLSFNNAKNIKWIDAFSSVRLLGNRLYFDSPAPVFLSNNPMLSLKEYDEYKHTFNEDVYSSHQVRDEFMPDAFAKSFWNLYYSQTDISWRLQNVFNFNRFFNSFYLPFFTFGFDYDFRNWQTFLFTEDAYWESFNSIYSVDDYLTIRDDFEDYSYYTKILRRYNRKNRPNYATDYVASKPFKRDLYSPYTSCANFLYSDETASAPFLLSTRHFGMFPTITNINLMEDSYDFFKNLNYLSNVNSKTFFNFLANYFSFNNHIFICDIWRSDVEDFSWFYGDQLVNSSVNLLNSFVLDASNLYYFFWNVDFFNCLVINWNNPAIQVLLDSDAQLSRVRIFTNSNFDNFNFNKILRFSNYFHLRAPSRDLIATYNAYQKVYKPRFDENRAHAKTTDLTNVFVKQHNITAPRAKYERLLGKNKENFFKINTYKNDLLNNFNSLYDCFTDLNYYFFDLPFLLALKSDASRYFWFDWFARWGMYEVQPSSASKYSILGLPYFNKNFDFTGTINEEIFETENYFVRIARARRNYLPTWTHSPYFYVKNASLYRNNIVFDVITNSTRSMITVLTFFDLMNWYWTKLSIFVPKNYVFVPSNSNINFAGRSNWVPKAPVSCYHYQIATLIDILTKREFLYREFLFARKKIINLPNFVINSPKNSLIYDLKAAFLFTTPSSYNNEYSRDIYYNSLVHYNFNSIRPIFFEIGTSLGLPVKLLSTLEHYLIKPDVINNIQSNNLVRSQYRPMRKGITNMIRLHGTGAVAMPIEIRLQILASSKDVIHSWAIPSAGVKIDCVPGFSSHRVLIFLVSGIYWGQCMEVCGRYHHWMPIIVYFMKRDLFFLWCTHFVFLSGANNMWVINDRQFTNYARTVSFDKNTWINELK